jgi:hypothetical protein
VNTLTIRCVAWRPRCRNTLRGFASIRIEEMHLAVHSVAIHTSHGKAWAQLPSQPWLKDGKHVTDGVGKGQYSPLFEFDSAEVRQAFSDAVLRAVLQFDARALDCKDNAA